MVDTLFASGDRVVRTGPDLPHLAVFAGQTYEVEEHMPHQVEGLFLKGLPEGLDPANFKVAIQPWGDR